MATITTRSGKGSPLTNTEVDNNFENLNSAKYESGSAAVLESVEVVSGGNTSKLLSNDLRFLRDGISYIRQSGTTGSALIFTVNGDTQQALALGVGGAVFNEQSFDMDFRVESNDNANMLFVDAGANRVAVGTVSPDRTFDVRETNAGTFPSLEGSTRPTGIVNVRNTQGGVGGPYALTEYFVDAYATNWFSGVVSTNSSYGGYFTISSRAGTSLFRENLRMYNNTNGAIFNEGGADIDFRVESDTNTHMLFVDAGNNRVGINNSGPVATLDVTGDVIASSGFHSFTSVQTTATPFGAVFGGGPDSAKILSTAGTSDKQTAAIKICGGNTSSNNSSAWISSQYTGNYAADLRLWVPRVGNYVYGDTDAYMVMRATETGTDFYAQDQGTTNGRKTISYGTGSVVVNEDSADMDFRVESDTNTHALFVDASTDKVSVGTGAMNQRLTVAGAIEAGTSTSVGGGVALYHAYGAPNYIANWGAKYSSGGPAMNYGGYWSTQPANGFYSTYANFTGSHASLVIDGSELRFYADSSDSNAGIDGAVSLVEYFTTGRSGTVVNEQSVNHDFRVETDGNSSALFVDASSDNVGIKNSNPSSSLNVSGNKAFSWNVGAENVATMLVGDRNTVARSNAFAVAGTTHDTYYPAAFVIDSQFGVYGAYDTTFYLTAYGVKYAGWNSNIRFDVSAGTGTRNNLFMKVSENVFNDDSYDLDFRVESDNNSVMFVVDAGNDAVWVNGDMGFSDVVFGVASRPSHHSLYAANETSTYATCVLKNTATSGTRLLMSFRDAANVDLGTISHNGSGVTYATTSDRRLKENIEAITDGTEKLMAMRPVTHTWVANPEAPAVHGFIAQEMIDIVPEAVTGTPDGEEMMSMDYGRITPVLVAALQDAHKKIAELEARLNTLEGK